VERQAAVNGANATVLIVDDNDDVRDYLRLLFHIDGFAVVGEAADGIEAAILANELSPDLVVMDHLMPRRSGDKTAAVIRATVPHAHILAYSAVLNRKPEWADGFVPKGNIADLLPAARELLAVSH
jgi:DNA-binding NarL/FixJ family response regulator